MFFYVVGSMVLGLHIIGYGYCNGSFFALVVGLGIALLCFLLGLYIDYDMHRDHKWLGILFAMAICGGAILIYGGFLDLCYLEDFVVSSVEADLGWKYGVFQYSIRGFLLLMFIVVTLLNVLCICCPMHECNGSQNNDSGSGGMKSSGKK